MARRRGLTATDRPGDRERLPAVSLLALPIRVLIWRRPYQPSLGPSVTCAGTPVPSRGCLVITACAAPSHSVQAERRDRGATRHPGLTTSSTMTGAARRPHGQRRCRPAGDGSCAGCAAGADARAGDRVGWPSRFDRAPDARRASWPTAAKSGVRVVDEQAAGPQVPAADLEHPHARLEAVRDQVVELHLADLEPGFVGVAAHRALVAAGRSDFITAR